MPDEAGSHERTWMAFGASREIWGSQLLPEVRRNLADKLERAGITPAGSHREHLEPRLPTTAR